MEELGSEVSAFALAQGVGMMVAEERCSHAPITLLPTPVERAPFEHAIRTATPFNLVVDRIARDEEFLNETLSHVLGGDDFTRQLFEIYDKVRTEGIIQPCFLGMHRSDYMLGGGMNLLQVELNTIASSFGCLAARVGRVHKYMLERFAENQIVQHYVEEVQGEGVSFQPAMLPENKADKMLPSALGRAAEHYMNTCKMSPDDKKPAVLFVVLDGEKNSFDQRWLEYELWDSFGFKTLRRSLTEVSQRAKLKNSQKSLHIDGEQIAVVYFRAGYSPDHYAGKEQWDARLLIERSDAIKCPSIAYHLVGAKKVQQELARPGKIERFAANQEEAKLLRSCFAGLWSLDEDQRDEETEKAIADAIANPQNYVVKPQREGGGNNLYGDKVKQALTSFSKSELASYILMERIFPNEVRGLFVREGKVVDGKALQEMGVYGIFLGDGNKVIFNEHAGQLLRTKLVGVDEGGVATGYSCIDSPMLT